jgi:hypothetical protein
MCRSGAEIPENSEVLLQAGRIVMTRSASTHNPKNPSARDSAPMPGKAAKPPLPFLKRNNLLAPVSAESRHPRYFRDDLRPRPWHIPYGEALMAGDSSTAHEAIVRAKRAILNRYLELAAASESEADEAEDLAKAVDVLQELKKST